MPGAILYRKSEDDTVVNFIKKNEFEKRECDEFREANREKTEVCKCGYSKNVHSRQVLLKDTNESGPSTKTSPTDAFGRLDFVEVHEDGSNLKTELKNKRYIRLDYKTDAKKILKLFRKWGLVKPDLILSVLSDSDSSNKKIEPTRKELIQSICRSIVDVAASTNAWIITGGLNEGVDELIGSEANKDNIVLGVSNWGCLEEKKCFLSDTTGSIGYAADSYPSGFSLNQRHTHFLLVDDGTQMKSGCECSIRQIVEFALRKRKKNEDEANLIRPLIYILIGGSANAIDFVERALANRTPVIIATGTGGAADIISGAEENAAGFTFKHFPEIAEKLFHQLEELLGSDNVIRKVIANIAGETKLELFCEIIKLLETKSFSENDIANMQKEDTNDLLVGIKKILIAEQRSDRSKYSAANLELDTNDRMRDAVEQMLVGTGMSAKNAKQSVGDPEVTIMLAGIKDLLISEQSSANDEFNKVNRMRVVIEQMLVVNGIPPDNAKRAVFELDPDVLSETLVKVKRVLTNLTAIRTYNETNLLIKFDIKGRPEKIFTSVIVDALKTVNCDVYMLVAGWNMENVFKQLLLDNWMRYEHQNLFWKLLKKGKAKYVKLVMEHISDSSWLTKPDGPLVLGVAGTNGRKINNKDFKKSESEFPQEWEYLLKQINDPDSKKDKDTYSRMKAKMFFIWCIRKQCHETAMLFWKQGQDCLAMALVAYRMSEKQMEDLVDTKEYDPMKEQMQYFSNLATKLLLKCFADNNNNTLDLLVGVVEDLDGLTPLQIAVDANFKAFIAEVPVQRLLDKIWAKNIEHYSKYKYAPILLSEACPLLAPVLLKFEEQPPYDSNEFLSEAYPLLEPILSSNLKLPKKLQCMPAEQSKCVRSYFSKVGSFLDTPFVKFSYGFISYIGYLILFSIVLLTDFRSQMSPLEIALHVWTLILLIEEIRQVIVDEIAYIKDKWNYLDIAALTIYIIGFIVRMVYYGSLTICPHCLYVARIVLAFSLLIFFFRTLQFLSIFETLGSKIYMIRRLVADLVSFMLILTVFISAYGVVSNVILYPNQPLNGKLLQDVFYDAWWSLVLQFNRDDALGLNCNMDNPSAIISAEYCSSTSNDNTDYVSCKENRCPANNWIVSVLLAFYALLTVIMMLNVLIAMFTASFSTIKEEHKEDSKMQRYRLIREYSSRSMVPPPLCVITYPYVIIKFLYNLCVNWVKDKDQEDSQTNNESKESPLNADKDKKDVKAQADSQRDNESKANDTKDVGEKQNGKTPRQSKSSPEAAAQEDSESDDESEDNDTKDVGEKQNGKKPRLSKSSPEAAATDDKDKKNVASKEKSKILRLSKSPNKAFAKEPNADVQVWEQKMAEEICKLNTDKEERPVAQMESEKKNTEMVFETPNNFYETPLITHIIQQVHKKMIEQECEETDAKVSLEDSSHRKKDRKKEKKKRKGENKDSAQPLETLTQPEMTQAEEMQ